MKFDQYFLIASIRNSTATLMVLGFRGRACGKLLAEAQTLAR
jgi:hypothetical protein